MKEKIIKSIDVTAMLLFLLGGMALDSEKILVPIVIMFIGLGWGTLRLYAEDRWNRLH